MADVNLENEAKNLKRADVGTEVRSAPGGDEQIYVNKQGTNFLFLKGVPCLENGSVRSRFI